MTIKRRYKIIGGILLLAIVAVAAMFQFSTQSALVLAEALQFRRMLVTIVSLKVQDCDCILGMSCLLARGEQEKDST